MLEDQAVGLRATADGRAELVPALDCLGIDVLEARFDGWSVLVPRS